MNMPSPIDLSYFLTIANELNVSRAALALGISQPSLTLAIQRLEKNLGTPILVRHKRGVTLTKAGKQLFAHTRQLLENWENIKTQALAATHEIQGSFTLGCHLSLALCALPRFLGPLLESNPRLQIKLHHDHSRKIAEQVINLEIDIGIVVNPPQHPDLIIKHLDDDKIKLWRGKTTRKNQHVFSDDTILLCDPNILQTQVILKKLKKANLNYGRIISSNNLELLAELTKAGGGISILPEKIARARDLIPVTDTPYYQDEICLLYRGENRDVRGLQAIAEAIKAAFA